MVLGTGENVLNLVPMTHFSILEEAEDSRLLKVKIWLMHLGKNENRKLVFEKSVVEEAIPSLSNMPIVVSYTTDEEGNIDFNAHGLTIVKDEENDGYKLDYVTQAIGLIPESNNAKFEKRVDDTGVEREYLTVEGFVWKRFKDAIKVFNDNPTKGQSMELDKNFSIEYKDDGYGYYTSFAFTGVCALGEKVKPAMNSSTIEAQFAIDENKLESFFARLEEKMSELGNISESIAFSLSNKGGQEEPMTLEQMLRKYGLVVEDLDAKEINYADLSIDEVEELVKTSFKEGEHEYFALETQRGNMRSLVRDINRNRSEGEDHLFYQDADMDKSIVYVTDYSDNIYGYEFEQSGDFYSIKSGVERKIYVREYREKQAGDTGTNFSICTANPKELKGKLESLQEKYTEQVETNTELDTKFTSLETEKSELANELDKLQKALSGADEATKKVFALEEELNTIKEAYGKLQAKERATELESLKQKFSEKLKAEVIETVFSENSEAEISMLELMLFSELGKASMNAVDETKEQEKRFYNVLKEDADQQAPESSKSYSAWLD